VTIRLIPVSEPFPACVLEAVGWRGRICRSSGIAARTGRSERLADLTISAGATVYLCGTGGSRYLDPAPFTAQGLAVQFFMPPSRLASLPPDARQRATALADLAEAGSRALARHLDSQLAAWRSSPHVIPQPGPEGLAMTQRAGPPPGGNLALTGRPDGEGT
jgi:WbqC-like protein family